MNKRIMIALLAAFTLALQGIAWGQTLKIQIEEDYKICNNYLPKIFRSVAPISLKLHGTDYSSNEENVSPWLQLLNNNEPVLNGICELKVHYPNNSLWFFKSMNLVPDSDAVYKYQTGNPKAEGVYPATVRCVQPFYDESFWAYFRTENPGTIPYNLGNSTGTINRTEEFSSIKNEFSCLIYPFRELESDFPAYRLLTNITNLTAFFYVASADEGKQAIVRFNFNAYDTAVESSRLLGYIDKTVTFQAEPARINFSSLTLNSVLEEDEILEAELCAQTLEPKPFNISFKFNTAAFNSSFRANTKAYNQTLSVNLRGSGEVHISNSIESTAEEIISILHTSPERTPFHSSSDLAYAYSGIVTSQQCIDNQTLYIAENYTMSINKKQKTYIKESQITCKYACFNDECIERPRTRLTWLLIMFAAIMIIAFIGMRA